MNEGLPMLDEPLELLDLEHGDSIQLRLNRFTPGQTLIHPKEITSRHLRLHMIQNNLTAPPANGTPISVMIPVLRVFGIRLDKNSPQSYWDISSKRLQADLLPRLIAHQGNQLTVTITADGYKPTKKFSVEQGG